MSEADGQLSTGIFTSSTPAMYKARSNLTMIDAYAWIEDLTS
jgi:hypothetical protein